MYASDADELEETHELYRAGELSWILQRHQLEDYQTFRVWNGERQTPQHQAWVEGIGALYDNMWVDECGRRFGKTVKWLVADYEEAIRRPGCRGLIATPLRKSIGGIIVPLTKILFRDAPEGYFPHYRSTHGADHECLYIEATDSTITLVGLDKHPDATRGQFLDFAHISEAAFVRGLHELVTAVLMPQFRNRPWAWVALESSTAKVIDCDFNTEFVADAQKRGTYRLKTIRDNPYLSDDEIRREERRSGGKDSAGCRRELYCEKVRDADDMLVPEYDEAVHVVEAYDWPMPTYALAYVGMDPGVTDPFGLVGGYVHWERGVFVVQYGWQSSNASTPVIAERIRAFEQLCWGSTRREGEPTRREMTIKDALWNTAGKVWEPVRDALTWWNEETYSLEANPYVRTSDIDSRLLLDLHTDHGLAVRKAEKGPGSADANLQHLRMLFHTGKIVVLKNEHTEGLRAQLRSGTWNTDDEGYRTDWVRSKALGHCDTLAALMYVARDLNFRRNPNRPALVDVHAADKHVPDEMVKTAHKHLPRPKAAPPRRSFGSGKRPVNRSFR